VALGPGQKKMPFAEMMDDFHLNFTTPKTDLKHPQTTARLRFFMLTTRMLGHHLTMWCDFHQAKGHDTDDCLTLAMQLEKLA